METPDEAAQSHHHQVRREQDEKRGGDRGGTPFDGFHPWGTSSFRRQAPQERHPAEELDHAVEAEGGQQYAAGGDPRADREHRFTGHPGDGEDLEADASPNRGLAVSRREGGPTARRRGRGRGV